MVPHATSMTIIDKITPGPYPRYFTNTTFTFTVVTSLRKPKHNIRASIDNLLANRLETITDIEDMVTIEYPIHVENNETVSVTSSAPEIKFLMSS